MIRAKICDDRRIEKYRNRLAGDSLAKVTERQLDDILAFQRDQFCRQFAIENQVRVVLAEFGVLMPISAAYQAFAKDIQGIMERGASAEVLIKEVALRRDKWRKAGLELDVLDRIIGSVFSVPLP